MTDEHRTGADPEDTRIDLTDTTPEPSEAETVAGEPLSVRQVAGDMKAQTSRIQLDEAELIPNNDFSEARKDSTVRVDLTGVMSRMQDQPEEAAPESDEDRSSTARIALEGGGVPRSTTPEPPRTVLLKRPGAAARPVSMDSGAQPPRTVVIKRPAASPEEGTQSSDSEGSKGATSRIQIPESALGESTTTGRKTILIKRSAAAAPGAKTLTITRQAKTESPTLSTRADEVRMYLEDEDADEPSAVFGVLSLAAVLAACILIYALLAQTIVPSLPFPGI